MKLRKRLMALLLVLVMMISLMPTNAKQVQAAQVDIDLGAISWSADYSTYSFPNVTVDFDNAKQKIFCLSVDNGGSFVLPNTINLGAGCKITGIQKLSSSSTYQETVTGGMELSSLTVIGKDITEEQISDFIKALQFNRNVDDKMIEQTVSVVANEVELDDDETAMAVDGVIHYYKYVTFDDVIDENDWAKRGEKTWYDAYVAAKASEFEGMNGYLATITEENEQLYIFGALGGKLQAWIGGLRTATDNIVFDADVITKDAVNPGIYGNVDNPLVPTFSWVCGPEAGTAFYQTGNMGSYIDGSNVNNAYTFWNIESNEPNNLYSDATSYETDPYRQEYALEYGYNDMGYWNDYSPYNTSRADYGIYGYIIEYSPYKLTGDNQNPTDEKETTPSSTDSKIVAANDIVVNANDFIISTEDAKTITDEIAKEKADITVTEDGAPVSNPNANIQVDAEDLADVMTGETGTYNVTYTYTSDSDNSAIDKATVTVVDITDVSTDGNTVLGANNFNISKEQATAIANNKDTEDTKNLVKELANAIATNNGTIVNPSDIQITKNDISATGDGPFDVTFTYNGETVTVQATVKDNGPTDGGTNNDLVVPSTNLTANDFAVEEGSTKLEADDFLDEADVVAKKNDGTPVTPTVNQEDLDKLNDAIENGPAGDYTVTVTTPDGTSTTVTVTVTGKYPMITGNDFIISVDDAADVSVDEVKSLADAERYEDESAQGDASKVTVDNLTDLNNKGIKGEAGVVTVTLKDSTTSSNPNDIAENKNVTATVVDETNTSDVNAPIVIGANNFCITLEQAKKVVENPTATDIETMLKVLGNAVAVDNGVMQDQSKIDVTETTIAAANGTYTVTYTYGGQDVTVKVTVKDQGGADTSNGTTVPDTNLTANDFAVEEGSTKLEADDFLDEADVVAKKNDGTPVTPTVNQEDLDKLNDAIENGPTGDYTVTVTTPDGTSTKVTVTVTDVKTDETGKSEIIAANNFTVSVDDLDKITGSDALDEVVSRSDAMAYEVDSKKDVPITSVDTSAVGNTPGETYDVVLRTENGTTATIKVTVTSTPSITANDFNISMEQAQTIVSGQTNADVQDMIKSLANAIAKEDTTVQDASKITVDSSKIKAEKGSYDVTFTYNGKSVTVKATVKDVGAADGDSDQTDVPNVNLTANDFTVTAGSNTLTPADFNEKAEVVAKKNDGTNVTATPDATDLAKLNEAIKNCTEGTYDVKVTAGDETAIVTVTVTKEKDVVGDDQLFEISNAKDIPQDLDKGREVSTVTVDGTDISSDKYTIDGDTITIDSSIFQKKKADTTSKVVITYKDGSKRTFNVKIVSYDKTTVVKKVPIFNMQKDLGVGKTFTINLVGMNKYSVKSFKSSNKKIATVNKNGVIKGKKKGKCKITARIIQNGSYYTVKINLHVKKSMKMYNLKKKALQKQEGTLPEFNVYKRVVKGKTTKMKFTNVDKDAKITYTTSNKKIATVSKKGKIKGKKKGFCVITAKIEQRGHAYYTKLIVRVDDGTKNKQLKKYLK